MDTRLLFAIGILLLSLITSFATMPTLMYWHGFRRWLPGGLNFAGMICIGLGLGIYRLSYLVCKHYYTDQYNASEDELFLLSYFWIGCFLNLLAGCTSFASTKKTVRQLAAQIKNIPIETEEVHV